MFFWRQILSPRCLQDSLLLIFLVAVAFLLGCYEMGDSDIWWHLRGGQWILENGRVPGLDPFTFGSSDKLWVDIHWSYEVILALAYRAGGVGALVLLGATVGAAAFLAVVTARRRDWPAAVTVLCWMPALILLSFRLDPRPEIFSLLYLGCYLAVLWRADERPSILWLLPVLQVLWTNVQGLFILGPILLGMFVFARGARLLWLRSRGEWSWTPEERRRWKHTGGVMFAVAAACLVNPYFLKGAWFPFDLFPKVADPNNPYKKYIDELKSPADRVREDTLRVLGRNGFFLDLYFLLPLLALSFLYPAAWRAWRAPRPQDKKARRAPEIPTSPAIGAWLIGLAAVIALLVLSTLTLSGSGPAWLNDAGANVPLILVLGGGITALALLKRCPLAAALVGVGGTALAAYMVWLDVTILGSGRGVFADITSPRQALGPLMVAGIFAGAFVLRWQGDLLRILLAGSFSFLAVQALQNWTRFALVAGAVLTWNFAEWAVELQSEPRPSGSGSPNRFLTVAAQIGQVVLLLMLGLWIAALVSDRFYTFIGLPRHFALREEPLAFAHDAAIFAGQRGLPDRALVYGLDQTGVYDFHNAPRCKPFMDGRLEMPDLTTFKTYVAIEDWLAEQDPHWVKAVADMGNPLVLLRHEGYSGGPQAALLAHPDWRCVYFDALAAVFVPRDRVSESDFPSVDFAARHFQEPARPSVPNVRRAAAREMKALYNLAAALPAGSIRRWRASLLLAALDRARVALEEDENRPDVWILLGNCYRDLHLDTATVPFSPFESWQVERDLRWAQTTYCFQRALKLHPDNGTAWRYLAMSYAQRGLVEAELAASEQWLRFDPKVSPRQRKQVAERRRAFALAQPSANLSERPITIIEQSEASGRTSWNWPIAERLAGLYMHLGRPADARRVWEQASDCPSPAIRHCRLACTFWVERDFDVALNHYHAAREADPKWAETYWGLAMLHTQLGEARTALESARRGLSLSLNPQKHSQMEALQKFLVPYAGKNKGDVED